MWLVFYLVTKLVSEFIFTAIRFIYLGYKTELINQAQGRMGFEQAF